jgi:O-antigen/teichoic acid export membrane protein
MPSIVSATRANLVLAPVGMVASLVATVVLVRALPPAVYVDFMSIHAIILTVTLIAEGGVSAAFMRYMPEMHAAGAARTLYRATMRRRLLSSVIAAAVVMLAGPIWARISNLDPGVWTLRLFAIISATVILALVQSVPYYGLLGLLHHGEAGSFLHASTLLKAIAVAIAGALGASVFVLASIHLIVSVLTVLPLTMRMEWLVKEQNGPVSKEVLRDSVHYGLASTVDKLTSWAGSTAVLLIVLAPAFSREALAPLAIAGDIVLKTLVVASMPVSSIVVPFLSQTIARGRSLREALGLACRTTNLIFMPAIAALISLAPFAVPLLFGVRYGEAVPLLIIIAIPTAAESWVRFVIVPGLLAVQQYRWLVLMSIIEAVAVLLVALLSPLMTLRMVVAGVGIVKLAYTGAVLTIAATRRLLPMRLAPRGMVLSAIGAGGLAWGAAVLANHGAVVGMAVAATVFGIVLAIATRLLVCIDGEVHDMIRAAAGRFGFAVKWVARC